MPAKRRHDAQNFPATDTFIVQSQSSALPVHASSTSLGCFHIGPYSAESLMTSRPQQ